MMIHTIPFAPIHWVILIFVMGFLIATTGPQR
jgi:hypothetical protein